MSVAYATLETTLSIEGQATIEPVKPVRISQVQLRSNESCGIANYPPTWNYNSFQIDGNLPELECSLVFDIVVRNDSTDVMYIQEIVEDSFNNSTNMQYIFSIKPNTSEATIPAEDELSFTLTFSYNNDLIRPPALTSFIASFHLVFQKVAAPVLTASNSSRNFEIFRGQTIFTLSSLDARLSALDDVDGDITAQITRVCATDGGLSITCPTTWADLARGDYEITYRVRNSFGLAAESITMKIALWDFIKINGGQYHEIALTSNGKLYTWGYGASNRLGLGSTSNQRSPVIMSTLSNLVDATACQNSGHAVDSTGNLYSWGSGGDYSLGTGSTSSQPSPVVISPPSGEKYIQVSCFFNTGVALTDAGNVYTWGWEGYGASGTGNNVDVKVPTRLPNLSDIVFINMGYYNGAAIDRSGRLYMWGTNNEGQLGVGSSGAVSSLGITQYRNVPGNYNGITDAKAVCIGMYHVVLVKTSGQVQTWGTNAYGRLGNGSTGTNSFSPYSTSVTNGVKCSANLYNSSVTTSNGLGYFFGSNNYGETGIGSTSPTTVTTPTAISRTSITDTSTQMDTGHILIDGIRVLGFGYGGSGELGAGSSGTTATPVAWTLTTPEVEEW
jgi:alpha-tubulin suppressor-like RCC1 family protein